MKTLTITQLLRTYKTSFDRIPKDGILIMRNGQAIGLIVKPDKKELKDKSVQIAEQTLQDRREVQLDTFTTVKVEETETTLGICDRCHQQGQVKRSGFLNEHGIYQGRWLCTNGCYTEQRLASKRKPLESHDKKEVVILKGDFGGSNEKTTF